MVKHNIVDNKNKQTVSAADFLSATGFKITITFGNGWLAGCVLSP